MTAPLQIYAPGERALVRVADWLMAPLGWRSARQPAAPPRRVLLLRLERIGDLLMVIDAIADARRTWPDAEIDLAVGSWNRAIAALVPGVSHVHVADAPWLSRGTPASWRALVGAAREWRRRRYDLTINFEPDIRSNALAWLTRAPVRVGYASGGGGALLTDAAAYDPASHVSHNARRAVARAAGRPAPDADSHQGPRLVVPDDARRRARALVETGTRPLVGIHASGGRQSKQWHLDRFAATGRAVAARTGATIVLTGSAADRAMVEDVAARLAGVHVISTPGQVDLPDLAGLLSELDVLVTGDTGPMHLAAAVGTPVVALFGPSDPARYGPLAPVERIVRVHLPCSPCGQVRLPPVRCRGHVPDCLDGITVDVVVGHVLDVLTGRSARREERP